MKINTLFLLSLYVFSSDAYSKVKGANFVPGEILVKYKASMSVSAQKNSIEREGGSRIANISKRGLNRVKLRSDITMKEAIADYKNDPDVEFAQPNYIYHTQTTTPTDPYFGQQWGFKNTAQTIVTSPSGIDAPRSENNPGLAGNDMGLQYAWDHITDCSSVIVAVVDTGINYNQSDLAASMWSTSSFPKPGRNFVFGDDATDPMDNNGHGTHVAGTIGAIGNNGVGGTGVCWKTQLMAVKVLDATGSGTTSSVIAGIEFAANNGAKVINMSLGGEVFDQLYKDAITFAETKGALVVVSAGNEASNNESTPSYPCNFDNPNIVCVAALTQRYALASFSNYGSTSVDVGAPGVNIYSSWPGVASKIINTLSTGWTFQTNSSAAWAYKNINFEIDGSVVTKACLVNPTNYNYDTAMYANNLNATAWKNFNLSSYNAAIATFGKMYDIAAGDALKVYAQSGNLNPTPAGNLLSSYTGSTDGVVEDETLNLSPYVGGSMSLGFNLLTNASGVDLGTNLSDLTIETLTYAPSNFNVISGTSMAAPHVAGLAAMLFAYNPSYRYSDVANSIKNGGVTTAALAGKTTTGKAVSATGSLNYISKPIGGVATKLP